MRISDWSSDVCSSDLLAVLDQQQEAEHVGVALIEAAEQADHGGELGTQAPAARLQRVELRRQPQVVVREELPDQRLLALIMAVEGALGDAGGAGDVARSEEHTSELQSLMRISYAVFCLKKQKKISNNEST